MLRVLLFAGATMALAAPATDSWLLRVDPLLSAQERTRYLSLGAEREREEFRSALWEGKAITAEEYFDRVSYVDARFGTGSDGSGAHTDQGRVYLALGPPTQIVQLPSSRLLQPLEIWRYDHVPGLQVSSEIQLLFFRARGVGMPKLYSPQIHTIRALLVNNAGTRGAFPVNDIATASDVANRLNLSPAEMEAIDAAFNVARGVRGSGNSELLARVSSPAAMLRRDVRQKVASRIYAQTSRPRVTTTQRRTTDRIPAIDLHVEASLQAVIGIEIGGVEMTETKLSFDKPTDVTYHHRLYLLPGNWSVVLNTDGFRTAVPVHVRPLGDSDEQASDDLTAEADDARVQIIYRANLASAGRWVSIGQQYLKAGDRARAALCFRKALEHDASSVAALAGLGRVQAMQNDLDGARSSLLAALQLQPDHYESLMALATVTAKLQDHPQALQYFRQAQAIRNSGEVQIAIRELSKR